MATRQPTTPPEREPTTPRDETVAVTFEVDADGLPTAFGYHQLYLVALEQLQAAEPTWTRKRREEVARGMTEAYCQDSIARWQRGRAAGDGPGC